VVAACLLVAAWAAEWSIKIIADILEILLSILFAAFTTAESTGNAEFFSFLLFCGFSLVSEKLSHTSSVFLHVLTQFACVVTEHAKIRFLHPLCFSIIFCYYYFITFCDSVSSTLMTSLTQLPVSSILNNFFI
jgi:hypothetical protein